MNYYYDKEADIFYISKGKPKKSDVTEEVNDGVIARFNKKTKEITGLTVLNFAKRTQKNSQRLDLPFDITFAV